MSLWRWIVRRWRGARVLGEPIADSRNWSEQYMRSVRSLTK